MPAMFLICAFSPLNLQAEVLSPAKKMLLNDIKGNPPSEGCTLEY